MADSEAVILSQIHYYCREGYYHSMLLEAQNGLKKYGGDQIYRFYYGLSLVFEGQIQEGIRELDLVKDDPELMLGAMLALIHAHRQCQNVDKEAVVQLETKFKEERRKATEKPLYYAGVFLLFSRRYDKGKEYIDRMLKMAPHYKEGQIVKGWLDLMMSKGQSDGKTKNALERFDGVLTSGKNIDALLGKAKFLEMHLNFNGALEILNQIIVSFPRFLPGLLEKVKIQMALQDWDQALDCANRTLYLNPHCVEARKCKVLHHLCVTGDYDLGMRELTEMVESIKVSEPKNAEIISCTAALFSRVCGRNSQILDCTLSLAKQASALNSRSAGYMTEVGYQYLLQNNSTEAAKWFRNATKVDESSIDALTGIIFCQVVEKHLDVAEQQLEFLKEIQKATGISPELLYLSAHVPLKRGVKLTNAITHLNECTESHFKQLKGVPVGPTYFMLLNPDFLLLVAKDYLMLAPAQSINPGQMIPPSLQQCASVLEPIIKTCPGLCEAMYLMAKVKFLCGEMKAAGNMLQHILDQLDATHAAAHLLMAEIHLHEGKAQQAYQSLERAISYKFDIRDHPLYHLIKARVEKSQNKYEDASKTLLTALTLAGLRSSSGTGKRKVKHELQPSEIVTLYLELVEVHRLLLQQHEAAKIMQDVINQFQGTAEEMRISIANADLLLSMGDVDEALTILRNIGCDHPYYLNARERMAEIYLHHRKDKHLFASCYRDVVEKTGSLQSYLMLGDAYMSIQEPEMAIEVYEQAMKKNPRDTTLARKIGQALVKTHNYNKAISYYKEAIKNENQSFMRFDLAELLMRLKQNDKAEKVLIDALENESQTTNVQDLSSLMLETRLLLLLAKVYQCSGSNLHNAITALTKARDIQARVLKRVQLEQPNILPEQKQLAANICCQMAEHAISERDFDRATRLYKEALMYNETDSKAMLDLARLYLSLGDLESCQFSCSSLLSSDSNNEDANVMMADLMFRKNDYEAAMLHFKQLLTHKPANYGALGRLIEVLRRIGKLSDVCSYLENAENSSSRASQEPGFNFCKGLYEWYTGNTNAAIKLFNNARKSSDWGQRAIYNMIEICLNPDNDTIGGEVFEEVDLENGQYDKQDFQDVAVRTADKLIKELRPQPGDIYHIILSNFLLLATRQKSNAEKALSEFMQLASMPIYRDHVGVLLGIATAHMILKQTPRARNQLKRVAKNTWSFEEAEYLERCWLLLSDIYIQSGKYDMASDLLKKVLEHNKSSSKAYEYIGLIMEKEQSYKDAARHYEMAWKFSNKTNPVIGYKLAFNYMKAKRYVDAIDVCNNVLSKYPNYPKIRKEILDKSRSNLRV